MLVSFFFSFITGIVKFPELQRYFSFVYRWVSASRISYIHDWSGIILVAAILFHILLFNRARLFRLPVGVNNKKIMSFVIFALAVAVCAYAVIRYVNRPPQTCVSDLGTVEVRDYRGERLDSISDFRENSIKGPQHIDKEKYTLAVTGLVDRETSYTYDEVLALPKYDKVVKLNCVEGWSAKILWEGTLVGDIIRAAGVKPGANTAIFYAVDGYSTSLPLDYTLDNNIILADKMNGVVLPPARGFPFELVAEDKWGYKWIKWITKIELSDNADYKGYWESRGYSNNGDLSGSKFE